MINKIRAALQGGHKSILNGIDSDLAAKKLDILFKCEIEDILNGVEEIFIVDDYDLVRIQNYIQQCKTKYNISNE